MTGESANSTEQKLLFSPVLLQHCNGRASGWQSLHLRLDNISQNVIQALQVIVLAISDLFTVRMICLILP